MRRAAWFVCAASAWLAGACTSSSSSTTFNSGVSDDKPVTGLSDAEVVRICERAERFFVDRFDRGEIERMYCVYGGLNAVALQVPNVTCETFVDGCLENPPIVVPPVSEGSYACDTLSAANLAGCDGTVGEIEACLNEIAGNFDALGDLVTCDLVGDPAWMSRILDTWAAIEGSACASLDPDCPFAPDGPTLPP